MAYKIAALYKFVALPDYETLQPWLKAMGEMLDIKGTLLLAREGINGTIAGQADAIDRLLDYLRADPRLDPLDIKFSESEEQPFLRFKVRLKREIVTLGIDTVDPTQTVGTYVDPSDWNALISDPDTVVIDTRNRYEISVGSFEGAIDPKTDSFREFPEWVQKNEAQLEGKRVAMFCTGGIRCEKASSYMLDAGYPEVFHLKGGILKYLETHAKETSLWNGDCFVFDQRVAVGHGLSETDWDQCFACRMPITPEDKHSEHYQIGVSCPHCIDKPADRARFKERQRQIELARGREQKHLGRTA